MKKKHLLMALSLVAMLALFTGCTKKKAADDGKIKIGILQLIDQSALDEARKGFVSELKAAGYEDAKNITIDYVNAEGDQSNLKTMSERLARDKNTLNLAIATPAAQAMITADQKTPLLFTAITDPVNAGLVSNLNKPNKNATGVTDSVPVASQLDLLQELFPKAKTIGLLYNAAEPNSVVQIKQAEKILKKKGIAYKASTVATTNDVEQATASLAKQVDAIYIPADNVLTAAMATVGKVSEKAKVPVIPATIPMVELGGVATRGIDYNLLGRQTAKMAIKIIKDKKAVKDLPVEKPAEVKLSFNDKLAKLFKIDPSEFK
ncbi:ABC transporter substrate binding protein [Lapidilactobacillus mulanensis]|uniref:ABC transporter substrate binding protein n=1 Tax=Lapidilactobacillus mulanensis TaxID=2485999 RepID=A0ABW4DRI0_9LACO